MSIHLNLRAKEIIIIDQYVVDAIELYSKARVAERVAELDCDGYIMKIIDNVAYPVSVGNGLSTVLTFNIKEPWKIVFTMPSIRFEKGNVCAKMEYRKLSHARKGIVTLAV